MLRLFLFLSLLLLLLLLFLLLLLLLLRLLWLFLLLLLLVHVHLRLLVAWTETVEPEGERLYVTLLHALWHVFHPLLAGSHLEEVILTCV